MLDSLSKKNNKSRKEVLNFEKKQLSKIIPETLDKFIKRISFLDYFKSLSTDNYKIEIEWINM